MWGGVHYRFSGDASLTLGRAIGKKVLETYYPQVRANTLYHNLRIYT